jgi:PAS domain S-box-containing protein
LKSIEKSGPPKGRRQDRKRVEPGKKLAHRLYLVWLCCALIIVGLVWWAEFKYKREILSFVSAQSGFKSDAIIIAPVGFAIIIILVIIFFEERRRYTQMKKLEQIVKKRTEELSHSEKRYRALVEQSTAITYVDAMDDKRSNLYISPQIEELLGYSSKDWSLDSDLWQKIIHPDDYERVQKEYLRTNATREPFSMDYRVRTRKGRVIWVHDEAVLMDRGESKAKNWQGVLYDITERKKWRSSFVF